MSLLIPQSFLSVCPERVEWCLWQEPEPEFGQIVPFA